MLRLIFRLPFKVTLKLRKLFSSYEEAQAEKERLSEAFITAEIIPDKDLGDDGIEIPVKPQVEDSLYGTDYNPKSS